MNGLLKYWMRLAQYYDTYGVPIDLIYVNCQMRNALPFVVVDGIKRDVTSEEFESGIMDCVRVRQAGGVHRVVQHMMTGK